MAKEWLIYDGRSGLFRRESGLGYGRLGDAGFYAEADAKMIASNPDPNRMDRAHHISEYRDQILRMTANAARLSAALAEAEGARKATS